MKRKNQPHRVKERQENAYERRKKEAEYWEDQPYTEVVDKKFDTALNDLANLEKKGVGHGIFKDDNC